MKHPIIGTKVTVNGIPGVLAEQDECQAVYRIDLEYPNEDGEAEVWLSWKEWDDVTEED